MIRIILSHQTNIRDIAYLPINGPYHIEEGRIFRGGAFGRVNEDDIEILESLHITDVVDFRGEEEFEHNPDYPLPGVRFHNFPPLIEHVSKENKEDGNLIWFIEKSANGYEHMKMIYRELVSTEKGISAYKKFFQVLQEEGRTVYFHCSQGKDRAGIAAYLLEIALGVSEEDAIKDYLESNLSMLQRVERIVAALPEYRRNDEKYLRDLDSVFLTNIDYLKETIDEINRLYGSTMNFLINVLEVDIKKLRQLYVRS